MTREEYKSKRLTLDSELEAKVRDLNREYALSNNPVNIGDIITDHYQTIKVEEILVGFGYNLPCCVYRGPVLTKSGALRKDGKISDVYQDNIESIKHS